MRSVGYSGDPLQKISGRLALLYSMLRDHRVALDLDLGSEELAVSFLEATRLQLELMVERSKRVQLSRVFPRTTCNHSSALQAMRLPQRNHAAFARTRAQRQLAQETHSNTSNSSEFLLNLKRIPARNKLRASHEYRLKLIESNTKTSRVDHKTSFETSCSPESMRHSYKEMKASKDRKLSPKHTHKQDTNPRAAQASTQPSQQDPRLRSTFTSSAQKGPKESPRLNFLKKRKVQQISRADQTSQNSPPPTTAPANQHRAKHRKHSSQSLLEDESLKIGLADSLARRLKLDMSQLRATSKQSGIQAAPAGFLSVRDKDYSVLLPGHPPTRESRLGDLSRRGAAEAGDTPPPEQPDQRFVQSPDSRNHQQSLFPVTSSSPGIKHARSLLVEQGIKTIRRKL